MGKNTEHVPIRRCVTCGARRDKAELLRIVLDREGRPVRDEKGRMQGRGGYVCRKESCLDRLVKVRWDRVFHSRRERGKEPAS